MIAFKDKTFCAAHRNGCVNTKCGRYLTTKLKQEAKTLDLPIAFADFSGNCQEYRTAENEKADLKAEA